MQVGGAAAAVQASSKPMAIRALYNGVWGPLAAAGIMQSAVFGSFEFFKKKVSWARLGYPAHALYLENLCTVQIFINDCKRPVYNFLCVCRSTCFVKGV
jgi:hypothetical protein